MTFSMMLRRLVMCAALCQLLSFVLFSSLTPPEPQVYYGPLVDGFVRPLFAVSWWLLTSAGIVQGLFTWEKFKEFE